MSVDENMLPVSELKFGFSDAENYKRKENKDLFNKIFLRNEALERLTQPHISFLIGEKGTGKTAYAVYFENNNISGICAKLKYIRETEYQKFIVLKNNKHLSLSDYTNIWKVIIYLLISQNIIDGVEGKSSFLKRFSKFAALHEAIDEFYNKAFSPEIIEALHFVESAEIAAKLMAAKSEIGGKAAAEVSGDDSRFKTNLLYIQRQFEEALKSLKLNESHLLFIDGIDIRPESIAFSDYLECVKGLANATWSLNSDFFANIKDSSGRLRVILLVRPDIFNSLGLQNRNNKIRDNSVLLDWRTTYHNYRLSEIFRLIDRLLSAQQDKSVGQIKEGACWDYYFPFDSVNVDENLKFPTSFIGFLRFSFYRPRDIITLMGIMHRRYIDRHGSDGNSVFSDKDFDDPDIRRDYSNYLLGEIKDHLEFYYTDSDYEIFLKFFEFLNGKYKFDYEEFIRAFSSFLHYIQQNKLKTPQFCESHGTFLQFLYDLNILCYFDYTDDKPYIRWCFRQRELANISPKVKLETDYEIHYALRKALNLGQEISDRKAERIGVINWYDAKKGYGFVKSQRDGKEFFIHSSVVKAAGYKTLLEGQRLNFDIGPGKNGKIAVVRFEILS